VSGACRRPSPSGWRTVSEQEASLAELTNLESKLGETSLKLAAAEDPNEES
jgi:hypothetical protein